MYDKEHIVGSIESMYIDAMHPVGLRSAPKIFNAIADGLEWCVISRGVAKIFHCLDDFAVAGPLDLESCHQDLVTTTLQN